MCLNVLRCMGVSTVEKGDPDVEDSNGRYAPVEEAAAARIHPSGNGHHNPPKNTTHAARHPTEQHHDEDEREAGATRKGQIETTRAAAAGSPVKAKKEEYPSEHSFTGTNKTNYKETAPDQFNGAVAGQPRRGHDDDYGGDAYGNSRAAMSDSARELRSPVMAKKEESRPEQYSAGGANKATEEYSPADRLRNVVAGQPRRSGGYDDEGLRGGTVPAGDAATYPGQYKAAHGAGDAYGNSTYMYADQREVDSWL